MYLIPSVVVLICITGSTFCNAVDVIRAAENHIHFQYQIDTSLFTSCKYKFFSIGCSESLKGMAAKGFP